MPPAPPPQRQSQARSRKLLASWTYFLLLLPSTFCFTFAFAFAFAFCLLPFSFFLFPFSFCLRRVASGLRSQDLDRLERLDRCADFGVAGRKLFDGQNVRNQIRVLLTRQRSRIIVG